MAIPCPSSTTLMMLAVSATMSHLGSGCPATGLPLLVVNLGSRKALFLLFCLSLGSHTLTLNRMLGSALAQSTFFYSVTLVNPNSPRLPPERKALFLRWASLVRNIPPEPRAPSGPFTGRHLLLRNASLSSWESFLAPSASMPRQGAPRTSGTPLPGPPLVPQLLLRLLLLPPVLLLPPQPAETQVHSASLPSLSVSWLQSH